MTTAYWCVFIVVLLPYIWVLLARAPGFSLQKNLIPRITGESFKGVQQRLYWAHLNSLEAIAPFAAAVIIAQSSGAQQQNIDMLALAFVGFRIAYALAYIANVGLLRSMFFASGMGCVVALFLGAT